MTSEIFSGSIALEEGDVGVDFEVSLDRVRLAAGTVEIGTWNVAECHIGDAGGGTFQLTAEGETLLFRAVDPAAFAEMVARRFRATGLTERLRSLAQATNGTAKPSPAPPAEDDALGSVEEAGGADQAWPTPPAPADAAGGADQAWPAPLAPESVEEAGGETLPAAEEPAAGEEPPPGGDPGDPWIADSEPGWPEPAPERAAPEPVAADSPSDQPPHLSLVLSDFPSGGDPAAGRPHGPPSDLPEIDADTIARWRSAADPGASQDSWFPRPGGVETVERAAEPEVAEGGGGRFRGSSLQRLSAAVTALKSRPAAEPALEPAEEQPDEPDDGPSVADQILESQRQLRSGHTLKKFTAAGAKKAGLWAAGLTVVAGLGFATPRVLGSIDWESDPVPTTVAPTTTVTVPVTTTLGETTTTSLAVPDEPVFDLPSQDFAASWNAVAADVSSVLALPPVLAPGPFSQPFTSHLSLEGVVGEDGTLDTYTLTIDPTGPTESDRLGILTLGVAVATAAPDLSGPGRAELLRALGLDVSAPRLEGVDGRVERGGVLFSLRYEAEAVRLVLTVEPGGA